MDAYVALAGSASLTGPNALQWRLVGLDAIKSLSASAAISTPTGLVHIQKTVPVVLATLAIDSDGSALVRIDSHIYPLTRRESRRFSIAPEPPALTGEPLLLSTAMEALKNFFETTSYLVLKGSTDAVLAYLKDNNRPQQWAFTLVITCAKWVPVQIRFAVLGVLVDKLVAIPSQDTKTQYLYAYLVHALLSSAVNMIGLSVIDIERTLLHYQATLIKTTPKDLYTSGSPSVSDLVVILRECVVALASHIYYATQVPDMISELLSRFQSASTTPLGSQSLYIATLLKTITSILADSSSRANRGDVYLTISSWDGTQKLLNHPDPDVRHAFANTLIILLKNDGIDPDQIAPLNVNFRVTAGPVGRIISELHALGARSEPLLPTDYILIYHILNLVATQLKVNGAVRVAALANTFLAESRDLISCYHDSPKTSLNALERGLNLSSVALALFSTIGTTYDIKTLAEFTSEEISRRKSTGLWYRAIAVPMNYSFSYDVTASGKIPFPAEPSSEAILDTLQYLPDDKLLAEFAARWPDIPVESRASIVIPLQDETHTGAISATTRAHSQRASSENLLDALPTPVRARSLKELGYNTRILPTFFTGINTGTPVGVSGAVGVGGTAINQVNGSNNDTTISLDDVPIDTAKTNESTGWAIPTTTTPTGDTGTPTAAQAAAALLLQVPAPYRTFTAQSFGDLRREMSPKVTDLKKAASGYGGGGTSIRSAAHRRSEYAGSVRSQMSRTSDRYPIDEKREAPPAQPFDVSMFLNNIGFDPTHERGKLV